MHSRLVQPTALLALSGGRADELYRQVNELAEEMTEEEKQRTYLDVRLDVL